MMLDIPSQSICTIVSFYCVKFIVLLCKGSLLCFFVTDSRLAIHLVSRAPAETTNILAANRLACRTDAIFHVFSGNR